ncbi:MAG: hypothetical protein IAA97_07395 [Spirochaetes bacterium]|uniref:GLUG domain-containing protein n=1 Tax=Candidatus Ornithospirochaeta stercoripullorum TaxID=2840899 RepID=A0A9D9E1J2_9SPIO|nr:hypothetical protein [Candidatus Ornithospirochaeta stercoripullorum]
MLSILSCQQHGDIILPPIDTSDNSIDEVGKSYGFHGGNGSESYPFEISNSQELINFVERVNAKDSISTQNFELINDINLTEPIDSIFTFSGTFDGNEKSIIGFKNKAYADLETYKDAGNYVMDDTRTFSAFIQALNGGTLKDVTFEDFNITAPPSSSRSEHRYMAVAVGVLSNGATIDNVIIGEGSLTSPVRAGGIAAYVKNTDGSNAVNHILNSINNADISTEELTNTYGTAGGILSTTAAGGTVLVSGCENTGTIIGYVAGGIAGDIQNNRDKGMTDDGTEINGILIENCHNTGAIKGVEYAGGILGNFWNGAAGDIKSSTNGNTVEYYAQSGLSNSSVKLGGIVGASVVFTESAQQRTIHLIYDCQNSGDVVCESTDVDAFIGGIIGSTQYGHITIENCYMTSGTLKKMKGPETSDAEASSNSTPFVRTATGGILGKMGGNQNVIIDSYATDSVNFDLPEGYRGGQVAGYFATATFGTSGYTLDDGTAAQYDNDEHLNKMMNEVLFTNPTEISNPFGILSAQSYSRMVRATNIIADEMYIGGASLYVPDEGTSSVRGKTIYDLTGCIVDTLHRDLGYGSRGGGSPQTSILEGIDIDTFFIDADQYSKSEYAPIPLYYEIDDDFSLTNNAPDHFKIVINNETYEGEGATITKV